MFIQLLPWEETKMSLTYKHILRTSTSCFFFFNWSFAARYIYPPLATIVSAWEYKKRYTVIQKCMWMALWEGWVVRGTPQKSVPSIHKIIRVFIVLLSTEKISQAILNSRNIALWYSGNLEIALVLMTVNMRWVQMLLVWHACSFIILLHYSM